MTTQLEALLGVVTSIMSSLAAAVVYLYRRETARVDALEKELKEERTARLAAAEKQLTWALGLQQTTNDNIDKLATITEAQQRRPR